jgi:lactate dehydrogenase-like 2-hydroxyacid dehydrogenase
MIIGYGDIGSEVARMAKFGFNMYLIGVRQRLNLVTEL